MKTPTPEQLRSEVRRLYLFSSLDEAQFDAVAHEMRTQDLDLGEQLFRQGEPARSFYFVRRGSLKLYRLSARGDEKVIEVARRGHSFAEAVMFMEEGYPVNAEAIEPSQVIAFQADSFRRLLRSSTDTCFRLMATMSRRLRRQVDEIDNLTLQNATCRLVTYLLHESPVEPQSLAEVRLDVPKNILASQLAVQPETFSRILSRLASRGFIEVHGQTITLQDVGGLRELVRTSAW